VVESFIYLLLSTCEGRDGRYEMVYSLSNEELAMITVGVFVWR
jgi:hypothetical protein